MTSSNFASETVMVSEDIEPYVGKWIAIRKGKIAAHAPRLAELRANPEVKPTDLLFLVPRDTLHLH